MIIIIIMIIIASLVLSSLCLYYNGVRAAGQVQVAWTGGVDRSDAECQQYNIILYYSICYDMIV